MAFTTDSAASAPFEYVMATVSPSAASLFAIAAPMPREAPVTSATFPVELDMRSPLVLWERFAAPVIESAASLLGTFSLLSDVPSLPVDLAFLEYQAFPMGIRRD
jgi:hypothetical protein